MAAILQLRRGTTTPSLAQSELFFNTTNNTLVVGDGSTGHTLIKIGSNTGNVSLSGNLTINGGISGSTLNITGNAKIDGNLTLGGGLIKLGDEGTDEIEFVGVLSGSLIPETDGIYDIGAVDARYNNIYLLSASIEELNGVALDSFISYTNLFTQSADSRLDNLELETGSITTEQGVQDGRLDDLELFSSSQNTKNSTLGFWTGSANTNFINLFSTASKHENRLNNLELFSSSQESKDLTLSSYTSSNDANITELFSTASNHESRIDVIEGTFSSSVDSRLDYLEGSFSTSVDDRLDQLEVHSGSTDSRLDNIEGISGSYATTGSNIFIGNQIITGSTSISGSFSIKNYPWASAPGETHLLETEPFSITTDVGTRNYQYAAWSLDNYQVSPGVYNPSFVFYMYDQSGVGNFGSQMLIGPLNTHMFILASGSGHQTYIGVKDLLDGTTEASLYGDYVNIGTASGSFIQIGNPNSVNNIEGSNLLIESAITGSSTIQGTYFHGDGRHLTNVTASYVEYSNVVNKPTLVSGSTQIDVNNTQNFQNFSSSVDSRLDYIEGGLSSSVDSQLKNIHQYTASLRDSIDVNGQDLTIYGNLTVQGTTTTLNTTELVIEDKLLSLASGSTTSAEADGAGLHISGADASMTWDDVNSNMVFNTKVSSSIGFKGDGSELTNIQHENVDFGGSLIVSGAAQVTQSLDVRYLEINGDSVVSGSSQITITDTTGFSTFSGSLKTTDDRQDSRLNNLESFSSSQESKDSTLSVLTSSYDGRLNNLESFSSSQESKDSTLGTYTSSIDSKFSTLGSYTSSIDTKFGTLETYTSSIDTKFSTLGSYTSSNDNDISNLESFTSSQESKNSTLQTYTASVDDRLSQLESDSGSQDSRLDELETFSASLDSLYEEKSSETHTLISGSDQLTQSLDLRYLEINGDSIVSGSSQVTQSLDLRYEQSGSVAQLVGIHGISGSLGSAAWYNVSSSISNGDPAVLGNAGAVKDYIDEQLLIIGAGDITAVIAGDGISGGADSGPATLTLDTASAHFNDGVTTSITPFSSSVSASIAELAANSGYINYVTNSIEQLTGIEVADFDNNVAVTFIDGTLKFIFGTPAVPSSIAASLSGFLADRFNNVNDDYSVNASWNNGGYTLISASLYEGSTLLTQVGVGTSLSFNTTTSGSHTYTLEYTGSSPLDGTIYKTSTTTTGTISKSNPASPTLTPSPSVQLGASSNQIEQGATGSIPFTSSSADPSNGWNLVDVTTNVPTPYDVIGSATGSSSIVITATANYDSPIGDNIPDLSTSTSTTRTYTKIRSLRYGASDVTSFTQSELENISEWDTSLGGSIGTIVKGTTNPSGQSVTISWSGDKYHYIVFDSARSNLSNITTSGFGVLGQFSVTTVGQYKVYKTNTLNAGGAGSSITYTLT